MQEFTDKIKWLEDSDKRRYQSVGAVLQSLMELLDNAH